MADKERTATAAFLPRGLGKGGAKGRHSSAQSQVGCNPENPGFFPSLHVWIVLKSSEREFPGSWLIGNWRKRFSVFLLLY